MAALNVLCTYAGWLVPFFLALRRHQRAAGRGGAACAGARSGGDGDGEPPGSAAAADADDATTAARWPKLAAAVDSAAAWVLEWVFWEGMPAPEERALAWAVHAALSCLLGSALAVWTVGAADAADTATS